MRPAPREPSKQLNANSLPVTKRRAASAFMLWASAGPAASTVTMTIANRAIMLVPFPQYRHHDARKRLLTMRIRHDFAQSWSPNPLLDLDHDSTPNPALDDVSGRLDHLGEPDFGGHVRKLSPLEVALQAPPRHLPIRLRTHD